MSGAPARAWRGTTRTVYCAQRLRLCHELGLGYRRANGMLLVVVHVSTCCLRAHITPHTHSHGTALAQMEHGTRTDITHACKRYNVGRADGRCIGAMPKDRAGESRERVQRYSITVWCVSTIRRLSTSSDARPARARISQFYFRLLVVFVGFSIVLLAHIRI